MTDVAQLTYSVDSSGLAAAERALDSQTQAAERTSQAAEQLEDRYKAIARRGMEYAEQMRVGNISERAQAEAAREAALGIDTKAQATASAAQQAERMAQRVEAIRAAEEREARAAAESARQKALQDLNLRKLLGSIDPTIAKLERLGQLEGNLERALDIGAITPEVFDQYQAKIDATRAATLNMGKAQDVATAAIGRLNLNSVEAQQSIAALARSAATGQWGMATSSITSLTARTGAMSAVFSAAGLAVGGLVGGIGLLVLQASKGYSESRKLEGVIIGMGNAAGVTTGQMLDLRNEIGQITGDYRSATEAINQLLLSGRVTGETLESVARSATNLARLTGQSIGSVTSEIEGLATGGAEALLDFNDKYNVLTVSTWENIEAIREQDGELAAVAATMREVERVMDERSQRMADHAGLVERAWRGVTNEIKETIQTLKDLGRTDGAGVQQQVEAAAGRRGVWGAIRNIMDQSAMGRLGGAWLDANKDGVVAVLEARADAQELVAKALEAEAQWHAETIRTIGEEKQARAEANEELDRRLVQMDRQLAKQREINEVNALFNRLAEDDPRHFDGTRERMLEAINQKYAERTERVREARVQVSEEERAVERLLSQFQRQEASMERQIALYGNTSRAAAMAYDIQTAGLAEVDAELARILQKNAEWLDFLDDMAALDKVWEEIAAEHAKYGDNVAGQYDFMSEHAKQAARNMQSHFANFLFDPFADGTKSMGRAFSEVLRRMVAEAAASRFFEMLGTAMSAYTGAGAGWVNVVGGFLNPPKREHGGPVYGGRMYQVGERNKPELLNTPSGQYLIPGDHGRVEPMGHAGGSVRMAVPPITINMHGAPEGSTANVRQNAQGGLDIDVILKQVDSYVAQGVASGTGQTGRAMKSRYGLKEVV